MPCRARWAGHAAVHALVGESGLLLGIASGSHIRMLDVLNPGVCSRTEYSNEALLSRFVGFEGRCCPIRGFLAKVFSKPVADCGRLQGLAACDFADPAQISPGLGFRQAGGARIPDRLQQYLALFSPVNLVDRRGLERHLLGIIGEAFGFVDIGGLCGNTHQA